MYAEDSFFTLSLHGRWGLAILSLVLAVLFLALTWRLSAGRHVSIRITVAVILFAGFVWLTPQIYYSYYLLLFEFLPWQVVIDAPPRPTHLVNLLLFLERQNLSFHSQGLLGWGMMLLALMRPRLGQLLADKSR